MKTSEAKPMYQDLVKFGPHNRSSVMVCFVILFLIINSLQAQSRSSRQTTDDPETPLMRAVAAGRSDEVRNLLKSGADVNEKLPGIGITALMIAAARGDLEMVK